MKQKRPAHGHQPEQGKPAPSPERMSNFVRGLATLLPAVLTIFVFVTVINFVKTYVVGPINDVIYWSIEDNSLGWRFLRSAGIEPYEATYLIRADDLPAGLHTIYAEEGLRSERFVQALQDHRDQTGGFFKDLNQLLIDAETLRGDVTGVVHPLLGLMVSLLLVLWMGWLVGGFLGRRLVQRVETTLSSLPGIRSVYPYTKRFVEFFFSENNLEFESVVALEYPSKGSWAIGFVTSRSLLSLRKGTGLDLVTIFVPSSPMPMTGYTVHLEANRVIPLPISVDDALRVTVSGGVLIPPHEFAGDLPETFGRTHARSPEDATDPPSPTEEAS